MNLRNRKTYSPLSD